VIKTYRCGPDHNDICNGCHCRDIYISVNLSSAIESRLLDIIIKYRTPKMGFSLVRAPRRLGPLTISQKLGEEWCQPIELYCFKIRK